MQLRETHPHNHTRYAEVEKKWWDQSSTAIISNDSHSYPYVDCSNATDSTGFYIYRKSGKRDGACFGMDFALARQDYDGAGSCKTKDRICEYHHLDPCVYLLLSFALALFLNSNLFLGG